MALVSTIPPCMGRFLSRGCPKGPIHFLVPQFLCSTWQPFLRPDPHLVWGDFCQGGAPRVLSTFSSLSFFVRPGSRFFVPTHTSSCGRAQERSRQAAIWRPPTGLALHGSEHASTLAAVGMTRSRGARVWCTNVSCHIL